MLYYLLTIAFLVVFLVHQYLTFIRIYYANASLNKLREVRHAAIMKLSINLETGENRHEAKEYRKLIYAINNIVVHFDIIEPNLTRFKTVKKILSYIIVSSREIKNSHVEDSAALNSFKRDTGQSIACAFNAVPFFKIRFMLHICKNIVKLFIKLGFSKFEKLLKRLVLLESINNDRHNNCYT